MITFLSQNGAGHDHETLEFIVDNAGYFKVVEVDYHGGLRYPHLECVPDTNDMLTTIAAPHEFLKRCTNS